MYIFAQIFKYFALFTLTELFLPFFWKIACIPLLSRIDTCRKQLQQLSKMKNRCMNHDLKLILHWFQTNRISLNVDKTTEIAQFFKKTGIHSMQGWTAIKRHEASRKRSTKRLKHTGNLFRKSLQLKDVC